MNSIADYSKEQYGFVQSSREALLNYCKTIAPADFVNEGNALGNSASMRNLLVHIANTYEHWIAQVALKQTITFSDRAANNNADDIIKLFRSVDSFMPEFFKSMHYPAGEIQFQLNGVQTSATPFKLFTHVITHEYHHKGQILWLSRMLGYVPVDTDAVR